MATGGPAWWKEAFGRWYPVVYPHRDRAAAAREMGFAVAALALRPGDLVLDLACGTGRHATSAPAAGLKVVSFDSSQSLLEMAGSGHVRVRGDMRRLPFAAAVFDGVVQFFTAFGYFETEAEDLQVLAEVARVLRPGRRYLLDYLDAGATSQSLVPRTEMERDGFLVRESRRIEGGRVKKNVEIRDGDGIVVARYEESVRIYDEPALREMVAGAGLVTRAVHRAFPGGPAGAAPRCILVAERAP